MTDPNRKTLHVPLSPDQAFALFTDRIFDWWPVESHSVSAASGALPRDVRIERRDGGQIIETTADGSSARWATITRWEPGRALGLSWHVGRDPDEATDIMVLFSPVETGTRVDLTHDGFDRLSDGAPTMAAQYAQGWDLVLARFAHMIVAAQTA